MSTLGSQILSLFLIESDCEPCRVVVPGGVVGRVVDPAAPDDPDPGAGQDAHGVGVVAPAGYCASVDVGRPGARVAGVVGEGGDGRPEPLVAGPAEMDGLMLARFLGGGDAREGGDRWGAAVSCWPSKSDHQGPSPPSSPRPSQARRLHERDGGPVTATALTPTPMTTRITKTQPPATPKCGLIQRQVVARSQIRPTLPAETVRCCGLIGSGSIFLDNLAWRTLDFQRRGCQCRFRRVCGASLSCLILLNLNKIDIPRLTNLFPLHL